MTLANIVARMERSEIRESREAGPGLRGAQSGLRHFSFSTQFEGGRSSGLGRQGQAGIDRVPDDAGREGAADVRASAREGSATASAREEEGRKLLTPEEAMQRLKDRGLPIPPSLADLTKAAQIALVAHGLNDAREDGESDDLDNRHRDDLDDPD
jgi:hypothetical protein